LFSALDGAPLPEGDILLLDVNNAEAPAAGKIQDGKFTLETTAGTKCVEIRASRMEKLPPGQTGAMGETEAPVEYIPARYHENSELTAEVTRDGDNHFDFALQSR